METLLGFLAIEGEIAREYTGHFLIGVPALVIGFVLRGLARQQQDPDRSQYMRRFSWFLLVPGGGLVGYALSIMVLGPLLVLLIAYLFQGAS